MTRWKLDIEYDGSGISGWQRQINALSVQQIIEEAIHKFSGETPTIQTAGRTDAGVHALNQVAHFDLDRETDGDIVRNALNFYIRPHKVSILNASIVSPEFNARFDALSRSYEYRITNRRAPLTFTANYALHVPKPLDLGKMKDAASMLLGHHDFSTFRAQNCQAKSPMKTLDLIEITQDGENFTIFTKARSFLYHQVRNMVGTLVLVGTGSWSVEDFASAFNACDRSKGGPTAPPHGLYFHSVEYPKISQ
ncbi:MAG: tRNA pseudouridine(38-40) synthase TruA [Alphaproteobacteria bacterium]|nr:tRNA pseudouridine(38-40) synthase TruA [Alphaproteobacteria bacterium]